MVMQNNEKKKSKKWIIILLIIGIFVGSFVLYSFLTKKFFFSETPEKKPAEYTVTLKEFVINLNNPSYSQYVKTEIALGYEDKKAAKELESKTPQMRDAIIQILRSKTKEQIASVAGTETLKKEIQEKINKLFDKGFVTNVYVTDFLVQ